MSVGGPGAGERRRRLGPHGEEFEDAGPAAPIGLMGGPAIPAEARAELLVVKGGRTFLCARPDGDVRATATSSEGLYASDMRHLSGLQLTFGDVAPVLLSNSVESGHRVVVDATNPTMTDLDGRIVPQETLNLHRTIVIDEQLFYEIELRNFCPHAVRVPLSLTLSADFADVFEVRGVRQRDARGHAMVPKLERDGVVVFGYEGQDDVFRDTHITIDPPPARMELDGQRATLGWELELHSGAVQPIVLVVCPSIGDARPAVRRPEAAAAQADAGLERWAASCTQITTDNEIFQDVLAASVRDLHALLTPEQNLRLPAAGIPWFVAPFGRDSLLTCCEALMLNPGMARETLLVLAALQADADEPWRDAEPGKILHELRRGELAGARLVPHTPYYGTADATPLFVLLAAAYYRWTGDLETLSALLPALERALAWIDDHGDRDGDGFVEYERRSEAGLLNQGWKDSEDSIVHADGTLASGPIALAEVQGYVYLAKDRIAEVFGALGQPDRGRALRSEAQALRIAFEQAFWNPAEGTFALALDGRKRQVASVTSNPGHCLYCGIVEPDKAPSVCERLLAEDMFSGWGVRTLSATSPAYNPMSYHNGSIWPHDNAIIAAGLKRYGHIEGAQRIATAMFDIAARARDSRLAELYCGFDRVGSSRIVSYPVACMPQAWAAAAPFMLLQALLGITAHAPSATLGVMQPSLPPWLERAEIRGLRVGDASVGVSFSRRAGATSFSLLDQRGELSVTVAAAARPAPPGTAAGH